MDSTKLIMNVGQLNGPADWSIWKYKISICLRGIPKAFDVVQGILVKPETPSDEATAEEKQVYKEALQEFQKADSNALIILTNNMSENTLQKIMRLSTAREVWIELHNLFDGVSEDKVYELCFQFFNFNKCPSDDISTHISKLKNLWNNLKEEISKDSSNNGEFLNVFLICKILGTLSDEYFSFKSSWMLMSKNDRTIDNLTNQLCAYEKALSSKGTELKSQEVLVASESITQKCNNSTDTKKKIVCHYCKKPGHIVRKCRRWIADGKPPKQNSTFTKQDNRPTTNLSLLAVNNNEVLSGTCDDSWYVDNGATSHVTNNQGLYKSFQPFPKPHTVTTASGESLKAIGKGEIDVEAFVNGKTKSCTLADVWYVPDIQKNLFSVLAVQDRHPDSEFISKAEVCYLKINKEIIVEGVRNRFGGLFKLMIRSNKFNSATAANISGDHEKLLQVYHERLGHQNKRYVKSFIQNELGIKVNVDKEICEGCVFGKSHRLSFGIRNKAEKPGELIHTDVCGPFQHSFSGYRYFVLFKDDYTKFRHIYFLKEKSEVINKLKQMLAETERTGHVIKEIICDNGGEFDNHKVNDLLCEKGIIQRFTMPYTPQQNGSSERENRTVVETARSIMHANPNISQKLWAEMINTAAYILNRTGPTNINGKSPYELWYAKKPQTKHLRIIGSTCYAHIPVQRRRKLDMKAERGILIGYDNDNGYRIWSEEKQKLIRSRDVIFDEKILIQKKDSIVPINIQLPDIEVRDVPTQTEQFDHDFDKYESCTEFQDDEEVFEEETENAIDIQDNNSGNEIGGHQLRRRSKIKPPERFAEYTMSAIACIQEPETYNEAVKSKECQKWKAAMDQEIATANEETRKTKLIKRVNKGMSDYQACWIPDAESEVEEYDSVMVSEGPPNDEKYDQGMDFQEEMETLQKIKEARSDQLWPDEVDIQPDIPARERFQKYRGLESFRTSPWDLKENLPKDYARIYQFQNFVKT